MNDDPRLAATRLAAVQAIYELDLMDIAVDDVLADFAAERWQGADDEVDAELARPKPEMLKRLVSGTAAERAGIDAALQPALSKNRKIADIEALLRAILRVACFELMTRTETPAKVLISAYVALGDAFFDDDGGQVKIIAGVLNTVARSLRPAEFQAAS